MCINRGSRYIAVVTVALHHLCSPSMARPVDKEMARKTVAKASSLAWREKSNEIDTAVRCIMMTSYKPPPPGHDYSRAALHVNRKWLINEMYKSRLQPNKSSHSVYRFLADHEMKMWQYDRKVRRREFRPCAMHAMDHKLKAEALALTQPD